MGWIFTKHGERWYLGWSRGSVCCSKSLSNCHPYYQQPWSWNSCHSRTCSCWPNHPCVGTHSWVTLCWPSAYKRYSYLVSSLSQSARFVRLVENVLQISALHCCVVFVFIREGRVGNCLCRDSLSTNHEFLNIVIAFVNAEKIISFWTFNSLSSVQISYTHRSRSCSAG